jgi:AcrR family transcriptional regulator
LWYWRPWSSLVSEGRGPGTRAHKGRSGRSSGADRGPRSRALKRTVGRPRDEAIDKQVVSAVLRVLRTGGYKAVTIERIARTVKRARASLYRRWPSKSHLVAYSIVSTMGASPAPDTGTLREDLLLAVDTLREAFVGPLRQALPGLVADMAHDPRLARAVRRQVLAPRRQSMREALERARLRGEASAPFDIELLLDMLASPFYFRTLFRHASVDRRMTRQVVDDVLKIVARGR